MTESADLAALAARTWERTLELNPTLATIYGDERYDDRLGDPGPVGRAARRALADETLAAANAIPVASLDEEERITRDLLRLTAATEIADDEARMDLIGAVQQQGHQALLPELVQFQKADTPERLERLLARLAAYPAVAESVIGLMDEGRAAGLTAARVVAERTVDQLERLLAGPAEASPIVTLPAVAREEDRARILEAVERHVRPADARYLEGVGRPLATSPACAPRRAAPSATRPAFGRTRASTSARRSSTGSGSRSSRRSRPRAGSLPGPPASATTRPPTGPR
jgi:uncharacterized protein (DUF885 family)